jgi:hypothetical protein
VYRDFTRIGSDRNRAAGRLFGESGNGWSATVTPVPVERLNAMVRAGKHPAWRLTEGRCRRRRRRTE